MSICSAQGIENKTNFGYHRTRPPTTMDYKLSADDSINIKHRLSFDNGDNSIATKRQLLIMLAPESPAHNFRSFEEFQDESTYDSFHNFETGELNICNKYEVRFNVEIRGVTGASCQ